MRTDRRAGIAGGRRWPSPRSQPAPPPRRAPTTAPTATALPAASAAPAGFPAAVYAPGNTAGGRVWRIAEAETELDIYVYRAGRLARFGHNHIITSRDVQGFLYEAKDGSSRLDLYFPVDSLSIDEPELRAAAGADFASQPSDGDIAGTRKNMLGERLLDAAQFPFVVVSGRTSGGTADAPDLDLTLTVRGISHSTRTTTRIEHDGDTLRASGELHLSHAELGLEPFSALGGALSVQDGFDVRYRIAAHPQ